ncbi:hypothetical protein IR083_07785 [Dysgonomonas sp. GY75]|uniref:hypothetical protein n=1 Tax=Dysgonomonas sp. GY75 TaxID=2780419 RepID=UPI001884527C|nr:hypothetical protein [Dysgonomonas sp. GY75]MBF0648718.1 hypothetical protein [Dysgonomonas sp. GY75]
MAIKKVTVITEVEIEYNLDLAGIDNILCEMDYFFNVSDLHAGAAEVKNTEIIEWR